MATVPVRRFDLSERRFQAFANLAFLILFPGFVAYHYAIASKWTGPIAGGLFGPVAVLFSAVAMLQIAARCQSAGVRLFALERGFIGLVTYLALWSIGASVFLADRPYVLPAVVESLSTLAIWLTCYFVGCRASLESGRMRVALIGSSVFILLLFSHAMLVHSSVLGPFMTFTAAADGGDGETASATYQAIGRSILVIALVGASLLKRTWVQASMLLAGAAILLCLGSRAHFFSCVIAALVVTVLGLFKARQRRGSAFMIVLLLAVGYVAAGLFLETRASEILDLTQSTSWQSRAELQVRAIQVIRESPFLGDFGYHHRPGPLAGYAHNALSVWAGYGGVAFFAFGAMLLWSLTLSGVRLLSTTTETRMWRVAFQVNLSAVLLAVLSEPIYASVLPALGWGLTVGALAQERRSRLIRRNTLRVLTDHTAALQK